MGIEFAKIILAYSLAATFVFTAAVTCLSMIGWVKFSDPEQQKILFKTLIIELTVVVIGFFGKALEFNPSAAKEKIVSAALADKKKAFIEKLNSARNEYNSGNLQKAYELSNSLFKSDELSEYIPIKELFTLNGDISRKREFWQEAADSYGPAIKLDPNNTELMTNSGYVQRQLQNYEAAENLYDRALSLDAQNWEILNGYFNCMRRFAAFLQDEYPKIAEEKFQKAAEIAKQMKNVAAEARQKKISDVAKGTLYWEWRRYDVAHATYKELANEYPTEPRFKEDLGAILAEMHRFDESKSLYASLYEAEKSKHSVGWYVGAGFAEATSKAKSTRAELDMALDAGLLSISNKPDEPFSYYAVALVYKKLGNSNDAIKYLKIAEAKEASRDTHMHTYDKKRHAIYIQLLKEWQI